MKKRSDPRVVVEVVLDQRPEGAVLEVARALAHGRLDDLVPDGHDHVARAHHAVPRALRAVQHPETLSRKKHHDKQQNSINFHTDTIQHHKIGILKMLRKTLLRRFRTQLLEDFR